MNWQPIETAPKDGTRIIYYEVYHGQAHIGLGFWWNGDDLNRAGWHDGLYVFPTHWMPIPNPPSNDETGDNINPDEYIDSGTLDTKNYDNEG